jgi:Sema domain
LLQIPANIFSRKGVSTLATTYTDGNSTFFYVASEAINATIPVFSLRQIDQSSQPPNFELTKLSPRHTADIFGSLTVDESRLTNHSIKPIFLQILARKNPDSRHNYGYLITVQLNDDGIFHTRLGRFCAGDPTLRSYTEVTIDCEDVWRHRIATAVALQEDTVNGDFLAVTFGKDSHSSNGQIEQALCIYSMAEIDAHFDEEIQHCYKDGSRKLLGWIKEEKKDCLPPTVCK